MEKFKTLHSSVYPLTLAKIIKFMSCTDYKVTFYKKEIVLSFVPNKLENIKYHKALTVSVTLNNLG